LRVNINSKPNTKIIKALNFKADVRVLQGKLHKIKIFKPIRGVIERNQKPKEQIEV